MPKIYLFLLVILSSSSLLFSACAADSTSNNGLTPMPLTITTPEQGDLSSTPDVVVVESDLAAAEIKPAELASLPAEYLVLDENQDDDRYQVTVFADLPSPKTLGSAKVEVNYDPTVLAVQTCQENPSDALDLVVCNKDFENDGIAPDQILFNAIAAQGAQGRSALVSIDFEVLDPDADITLEANWLLLVDHQGVPITAD